MRRRELIALLGATALPPVAMAQPAARVRRIGAIRIKNPDTAATIAVFEAALAALGWVKGGNLQIDYRVVEPDRQQMQAAAQEIVALAPELVHTQSTPITQELLRASTTRYAAKTAAVKGVDVWKLTVSSDVSAFGPTTTAAAAAVTPAHLPATRHVAQPTSVTAPRAKTYPVASHTRS